MTMAQSKGASEAGKSFVEGILSSLSDKHSQLDINLQGMSIKFPNTGMALEFNGLLTVTCHVRDMTEDEKKASAAKNISMMSKT
jgi:hypothetical protein